MDTNINTDEDLTTSFVAPMANPDFLILKERMWQAFLVDKKPVQACALAAQILQSAFAFDAMHVCGLALVGANRFQEGFDWLLAACALSNPMETWFKNSGIAFMEKKLFGQAHLFLESGCEKFPNSLDLAFTRGLAMCHDQKWMQAIELLKRPLEIDPSFYHAKMTTAFCFHMLGRYDEAIVLYDEIEKVATPPDREEIINNKACVLMERGQFKEGLDLIETEYPDSTRPGTVYNKAFFYLGTGNWPLAWDYYRHRQTIQVTGGTPAMPSVEHPLAQSLDDVIGKHVFVFHEQGLGDSLMFLRYAALLRPYVSQMTLGVPKSLSRVAAQLNMNGLPYAVVTDGNLDKPVFEKCDIAVPLLDIPFLLQQRVYNIPWDCGFKPFFAVDNEVVERFCSDDKLRVGITWAGATREDNMRAHSINSRRSIPFSVYQKYLAPLRDKIDFISLQQPDYHVNSDWLCQPIDQSFDVMDTMQLIKGLDLCICVDSAVAHMAASVGVDTWLLSRLDGCWRWFWDGRETSPWYPTMRIFRQETAFDWDSVMVRVADELRLAS